MSVINVYGGDLPAGLAINMTQALRGYAEGSELQIKFAASPGDDEGSGETWKILGIVEAPLKPTVLAEIKAFAQGYEACWRDER